MRDQLLTCASDQLSTSLVFVSASLLWKTGLEEDKCGAGLVWGTGEKLVPHFQSETGLKK